MSIKLTQVRLINVQSWDDLTLHLSDGLNVFSGKSNSGKSVMFKVFRKMCFPNFWGSGTNEEFIRSGCDKAVAALMLSTNQLVLFEVYPKYQMYYLFDENKNNIGTWKDKIPDFLLEVLGWYVDFEHEYLLNLIDQDIPLPFVKSPKQFNDSVLSIVTRHDELDKSIENLKNYSSEINEAIKNTTNSMSNFYALMQTINSIDIVPISDLLAKTETMINLFELFGQLAMIETESIVEPVKVSLPVELEDYFELYKTTGGIVREISVIENIYAPSPVIVSEELTGAHETYLALQGVCLSITDTLSIESPREVIVIDDLHTAIGVYNEADEFMNIVSVVAHEKETLMSHSYNLEKIKQQMLEIESELGVCPVCGTLLNGEEYND